VSDGGASAPARGAGAGARSGAPARFVTEVFSPAVLVAAQVVLVGWHAGGQTGVSRWWGLPGAMFAAAIPFAYVVRGVRRGSYADHHIPEREHRRLPLLFGACSLAAGLVLLLVLDAPRDVIALLAAGGTGLVLFAVVTHWWKISIHAGVAAGTVAVLVAVYGPWALTTAPMVPLVGWARLRLSAHTLSQVVVGAIVGALVAGTVFPALR
jgi:membrane-associated phospholipid phosphatase